MNDALVVVAKNSKNAVVEAFDIATPLCRSYAAVTPCRTQSFARISNPSSDPLW